ncbi:MAG: YlmH/Sll1252 family protein [Lachnospiraceae bacterium]|nr:YlmH/Sll1252 family protein [Lachnospiraceae bacterium]
MKNETQLFQNHIMDLAEKSYQQNVYTYSAFMTEAERSDFEEMKNELSFVDYHVEGGYEDASRGIVIFGSIESLGYEEEIPLSVIKIEPLQKKFADDLTHRDYLGALLNLGIERSTIGDFVIGEKEAYVIVLKSVSAYILQELSRIKHTTVLCTEKSLEEWEKTRPPQQYKELHESVASERIDLIVSKVTKLSRNAVAELFHDRKVIVNGRLCENYSKTMEKGDRFSVRGYGKFIYDGGDYTSKKGKLQVSIRQFL